MAVKQYDEFETARARILKAYRTAIRLKHSLRADEEIAQTLPAIQAAIDAALLNGEELAVEPGQVFAETLATLEA